MNFTKESKKFYVSELKGEITNNFDFSVKSLHNVSNATEQKVNSCKSCKLPLTASQCIFCQTDNGLPLNENSVQNFICKEVFSEKEPMKQSMILCIDLSGSMSLTYKSKYQKINQQFVKRVLGEKNFDYLKKKIGVQRVLKNYTIYQMFLKEGQSARSIAEMVKMEESQSSVSLQKNSSNIIQKQEKQKSEQYISRKQIVEIAVEKCIQIVKNRCPNTQITVVYFNQTIQIPTDNFKDKISISGIESKTVEEMISLGVQYSNFISRDKATNIGQNLLMNLTSANQNGQTALGPSLAFCFGLAQAFKNSLSQIIVITDGMSNIGFGQTENQLQQDLAKQFYEKLALKYAKPLNCIVNMMTFEDCCIGYDQLDRLIEVTGGIPCQIEFTQEGGQNMVTEENFSSLSFKMITAFCEYASRLCFNTKITICCSNQKVKLSVSKDLEHFLQLDKDNLIRLNAGVISNFFNIQVTFSLEEQVEDCQGVLKFMIICQFDKNNKRYTSVTVDKIKIVKGTKVQAEKEETLLLQKQIKEKLRPRQIFEQDIKQYSSISMKIQQNKSLMQNLDKELLEKFKKKKQKLENLYKNIDKLSREKMSMRSRAEKTYKGGQDDFDDGFK